MPQTLLHTSRIPVRWSDMDELGHVNNAAYFTYLEQARIEYFQRLTDGPWPGAPEKGPVLVNVEASFKKPIVHPATVLVHLYRGEVGRTSLPLECMVTVESDEETVYAEAHTTLVWIDRATGRPTRLPDSLL